MESEVDQHPDKIFVRDHFTIMEKLLFAKSYIEVLKKENKELHYAVGVLNSEKAELEHLVAPLKKEIENLKKMGKADDIEVKKEKRINSLQKQVQERNEAIKKLKLDNTDLICRLVQANK